MALGQMSLVSAVRFWAAVALLVAGCASPGGYRLGGEQVTSGQEAAAPAVKADPTYGKLALAFEANRGQTDGSVQFLTRGLGYTLFLTDGDAVLALRQPHAAPPRPRHQPPVPGGEEEPAGSGAVLRMRLVGATPSPDAVGREELPTRVNYFLGSDPAKWRTDVPTFGTVLYTAVYPGVDLVYYGNGGHLEFDFVVAPGTDPAAVRLTFEGAEAVTVDAAGDLVLAMPAGEVRLSKPVLYQQLGGGRRAVDGGYLLGADGQVSFWVGDYDPARALVVDPVLVYSTYLSGSYSDLAYAVAADAAGSAYVVGSTTSPDFPTANPLQVALRGGSDAFVAKLSPSGSSLVYATYLGGTGGFSDNAYGVAVDAAGKRRVATGPLRVRAPRDGPPFRVPRRTGVS